MRHVALSQWPSPSFASPVELRYLWIGLRATTTVDGKPQEVPVKVCMDESNLHDVASLVSLDHAIWIVDCTKITLCFDPVPLNPQVRNTLFIYLPLPDTFLARSISNKRGPIRHRWWAHEAIHSHSRFN